MDHEALRGLMGIGAGVAAAPHGGTDPLEARGRGCSLPQRGLERAAFAAIPFVVLAALTVLPGSAAAQGAGGPPLGAYAVDVWTTDDGLPQNSVNAIAQTPDGYLWVGTFGGLARFDGVRFTLVPRRDSTGSHLDRIRMLDVGPGGELWIGTERGLVRYEHGEYRSWLEPRAAASQPIEALHVDDDGTVWFLAGAVLWRLRGGEFEEVEDSVGGPLRRDGTGVLWYASPRGGGGRRASGEWVAYPEGAAFYHREDRDGLRWFSTVDGGVALYGLDGEPVGGPYETGAAVPHMIERDGAGDYWIGTIRRGLHRFRPDGPEPSIQHLPLPSRDGDYDVRATFVDAEGTLWAGTNGDGLLRVRRRLFRVYAVDEGFEQEVMTSLIEDGTGRMLLATNCGGLYELRPGEDRVAPFPWPDGGPREDCVTSLTEDRRGRLWIGGYGPLLRRVDGRFEEVRGPYGEPLPGAHALHTAADGAVWAGFMQGGLVAFPPDGPPRRYGPAEGLGNPDVRFVGSDADGTVWVGTTGGLGRLADGRFTWYTTADGLPAAFVRAVHRASDGAHWIGTYGGGLARLKDGRFTPISRADGLADDVVSAILEDGGNLWMTGNRGIFRASLVDLNAFADGRTARVHSVLYGRADGLRNAETNGGFSPAAWRARDGTLWFPTLHGAAAVDPARAGFGGRAPPAIVEGALVDGEPRPIGAELRAGPGRTSLEIRYTGLSLLAPEHIAFRYRLVGFVDDWQRVGTRRQAYYPRLPPGTYRFEVQAANRDGVWGEAGAIPIRVVPHAWQTVWFRLLLAAALIGVAGAMVRRRIVGLRRAQEAQAAFARRFLEGEESERRRVAGELHDSIAQGLIVAKNRATLALLTGGIRPELRRHLDEIVQVVSVTLEEARNISHNLRPHELDRLGLAAAVRGAVEQAGRNSPIEFTADVDGADGALEPGAEIAAFRIVQEGLNNVLKHSGATTARVSIERLAGGVRISIADDGAGFTVREDGFGLSGIRERAALLGGSCEIRSAPGAGTTIAVTLPGLPQ